MERLTGSEILRKYATDLEDPRRTVGVENYRRCFESDQHMLLALNRTMDKNTENFPDTETIVNWIRERLIEVTTSDGQSEKVGLFLTVIHPLKREPYDSIKRIPEVIIGVFPLYGNNVKYVIRPLGVDEKRWKTNGEINIKQESVLKKDPLLIDNQKGLRFLFFRESPFEPKHPYKINWSREKYEDIEYPKSYKMSLEENVISHALWYINTHKAYKRKPELFKKTWFANFINSHCSDSRYMELQAAFTQFCSRKR